MISDLCSVPELHNDVIQIQFDPINHKECNLTNAVAGSLTYEHLFVRKYTINVGEPIPYPYEQPVPVSAKTRPAYIFVAALHQDELPDGNVEQVVKTGRKVGAAMCEEGKVYYARFVAYQHQSGTNISSAFCGIPKLLLYMCLMDHNIQGNGQGYDFFLEKNAHLQDPKPSPPPIWQGMRRYIPTMMHHFSKIIKIVVSPGAYEEMIEAIVAAAQAVGLHHCVAYRYMRRVSGDLPVDTLPTVTRFAALDQCLRQHNPSFTAATLLDDYGIHWYAAKEK